jgi:hypothetical protein
MCDQHSEQYKTGRDNQKYDVFTFEGQLRLHSSYFTSADKWPVLIFPIVGKWSVKDYEAFFFYLDKCYLYQSLEENGFLWNFDVISRKQMHSLCDVELTIQNN